MKMIMVTVYADTTGFWSDEKLEYNCNMVDFPFPENIVMEYYATLGDSSFDKWLNQYTCDETVGLFDFAKERGYVPDKSSGVPFGNQF